MILIYRPDRAVPKRNAVLYLEDIRLEPGENDLSETQVEYVKSVQDSPDLKPLFDETALEWKSNKKPLTHLDEPTEETPKKTTKKITKVEDSE